MRCWSAGGCAGCPNLVVEWMLLETVGRRGRMKAYLEGLRLGCKRDRVTTVLPNNNFGETCLNPTQRRRSAKRRRKGLPIWWQLQGLGPLRSLGRQPASQQLALTGHRTWHSQFVLQDTVGYCPICHRRPGLLFFRVHFWQSGTDSFEKPAAWCGAQARHKSWFLDRQCGA